MRTHLRSDASLAGLRAGFHGRRRRELDQGRRGRAAVEPALLEVLVPNHLARCSGCLTITATSVLLDSSSKTTFLVPEQAADAEGRFESALMRLDDGSIFRVRGPVSIERLCAPGGFAPTAAAYEASSGRVWAATQSQHIGWVDTLALDAAAPCPFVITATAPAGPSFIRVALPPDQAVATVLTLSATSAVARISPGGVRELGYISRGTEDIESDSGFLVVVGDVTYAGAGGDDVGILRGDELTHQHGFSLGPRSTQAFSMLEHDGDLYFGFRTYNLYILRGRLIVPLDEGQSRIDTTWEEPTSLAVLQGNIVAGLDHGLLGQWSAVSKYCPVVGRFSTEGPRFTLNLRGALFWLSQDTVRAPELRSVEWLVPGEPESCKKL